MKTELLTVSRIFNEAIFRIPDYQRGYSWQEKHLRDFWADINQLQNDKRHYTGVLTLEVVSEESWQRWTDEDWIVKSKRYVPYYVVDGQQRLTTIAILICCIIEKCEHEKIDQLNNTPIVDIRKKYIYDTRAGGISKAFIFGYERDNPSYEYLKKKIFEEQSEIHHADEETIYTRNLKIAKDFFKSNIENLTKDEVEIVFTKVTQQLAFNAYEISKEIDVFVAFETMNNRGKPLSTLELLKNRLIYLVMEVVNEPEFDNSRTRREINDAWKSIYHYLGKNDKRALDDDNFLKTHLYVYYHKSISPDFPADEEGARRYTQRSRYIRENANNFLLNELFTRKRGDISIDAIPELNSRLIVDYYSHIKKSVEVYFKLSTPDASGFSENEKIFLERVGRLTDYNPTSFMLSIYLNEKNSKKRIKFLEIYERFLFLSSLHLSPRTNGYGSSHISEISRQITKYIAGKNSIDDLLKLYENIIGDFTGGDLSEIISDWVKNGPSFYGWGGINYFLYEYEIHLSNNSKTSRKKIDWDFFIKESYDNDYISIEHIYPQKPKDKYWTDRFKKFDTKEKRALRNSLGNLLALSAPKNSSLSNKPFPEKIGNSDSTIGYRFGSYSENEVAKYTQWTDKEIVERGIKMLDFLEVRWNIKIGGRNEKIKALGLSFLIKKPSINK